MNRPLLPDQATSSSVDGRTARRDRGRTAALEAALELFEEANLEPSPEQIAQRAGISTRSLYRYFEDRDTLVRAVIAHKQMRILPLLHIEAIGQGALEQRLSRFLDSRLKVYEEIGATARAMAKASGDPVIREQVEFRKSLFRKQVRQNFAVEFDRMSKREQAAAFNAIDVLTQVESLDRYLVDLQFTLEETRKFLFTALRSLLNSPS